MAEPPDLDELARRYVDLWEEHLAGMAGDPELSDQLARFFQAMRQMAPLAFSGPMFAFSAEPGAAEPGEGGGHARGEGGGGGRRAKSDRNTRGTTAAAAASGHGARGLDELARRLAAVEKRLDRLEAGSGAPGRGPKATPGRRKG